MTHTHTHTPTHARTRARTHAARTITHCHTHTHTHTCGVHTHSPPSRSTVFSEFSTNYPYSARYPREQSWRGQFRCRNSSMQLHPENSHAKKLVTDRCWSDDSQIKTSSEPSWLQRLDWHLSPSTIAQAPGEALQAQVYVFCPCCWHPLRALPARPVMRDRHSMLLAQVAKSAVETPITREAWMETSFPFLAWRWTTSHPSVQHVAGELTFDETLKTEDAHQEVIQARQWAAIRARLRPLFHIF